LCRFAAHGQELAISVIAQGQHVAVQLPSLGLVQVQGGAIADSACGKGYLSSWAGGKV
jgi:hypothetical protein